MATERKRRNKNGLERLSAWPQPARAEPVGRLSGPDQPVRPTPHKAIAHDLPALYHETYLRIIPRDPFSLFSFWETADDAASDATPFLRLYETDSGTIVGDYAVGKDVRSKYLRVPHPGSSYRVEYGTGGSGRFVPLCSSNEVTVPTGSISLTKVNNERRAATEALTGFTALNFPADTSPQG
ncbi:MAG: DUF4912 domain-containing protein, partial [Chitinispirillaceae bacterium]|nr:DUF4912 domain-containing protein [Chitinispirillaceae bacterium]